jgi:Transglutaminase-like superfamily
MARRTAKVGSDPMAPLGLAGKLHLMWTIWTTAAVVTLALRKTSLPLLATRFAAEDGRHNWPPGLLSRAVSRGLRIGPWEPRCLIRSLVLYRLLRAQGVHATLVIGLPDASHSPDAHAWVELDGRDLGPGRGAMGHRALARYPIEFGGHDD